MKTTQLMLLLLLATCFNAVAGTDQDSGLPISVQEVTRQLLKENVQVLGEVKASQDVKVSAQFGGRVMRLRAPLGAYVKRQDIIVEIRKKEAEALHALHSIKDLTVSSPLSGYVVENYTSPGEVVAAGQPLVRIVSAEKPFISLMLPGELLHRVKKGTRLTVMVGGGSYTAEIARVVPVTDPVSGTFRALAPLKTKDLYPGAVCRVVLHLSEKMVLAVPRSAILTREGQQVVFVVSAGKAQRRVITTGVRKDDLIEVKKGLKVGESVVVVGNYQLSDGVTVRVIKQ